MDDFLARALLAGLGLALVAGPLGCFVVWRRMSAFGDTMSHSALLGVVLSFLLHVDLSLGVFLTTVAVALLLGLLTRQKLVAVDALLAMLAHSSLAIGMVLIGLMSVIKIDLMGFLFGDILAVSDADVVLIWGGGLVILALLVAFWRPLLAGTVSDDIARAEGLRPERARFVFTLLMAAVVAVAMKLVGVLLVTALLIIPASAARRFARSPEQMAVGAVIVGVGAVSLGLYGSEATDAPTGPAIVVAALIFFILSLIPGVISHLRKEA